MKPRILWGIGVLTGLAIVIAALNEALPVRWHLHVFQTLIEELWKRKIYTATARLSQWREDPIQWETWEDVLFVRYSARGQLLSWNTKRWILPNSPPSLLSAAPEIVGDNEVLYYAIKHLQDSIIQVAFIPIRVKAQDPPWEFPIAGNNPWMHQLRLRESSTGAMAITLPSIQGMPLLRFSVGNPEALRIPLRKIYLSLLLIALTLSLLLLHRWLTQRFSFWKSRVLLLVILILVWQTLSLSRIPARLWGGDLFSPKLLSLTPFLQNLWDLEWLLIICAYATTLLRKVHVRQYILYPVIFAGIWGVVGSSLYLLALHSQIEPDPLRQPTLLKALTWVIVLGILWRASQLLLHIHQYSLGMHIGFTLAVGAFSFYIGLPLWGIAFLIILYLLPPLCRREPLSYLLYPIYTVAMVGTLNSWLTYAYYQRVKTTLSVYARRASILRDYALEYQLSQLLPRIAADNNLWLQLEAEDQLIDAQFIAKVIQKHLIPFAEDYELILSFWTKDNHRLDNLYERRPLLWHTLPPTASAPTLSPYLHLVSYESIRYIYVVRLPISPPNLAPFEMQIEFYPRSQPLSARLRSLPEPLIPVSYAIYENGKRIRQYGEETFPFTITERIPTGAEWRVTATHYEYLTTSVTGITLYLRAPIRDLPTHLAAFPVFLILLSITPILQRMPYILSYLRRLYRREGALAVQLQGLFGLVLILPLMAMLLISFFLSLRISQNQLQQELSQKLSSISAYLSANPTLIEKLSFWLHNYLPPEESHLRDLIRRVATIADAEIFIYTREGTLYSSTLFQSYFHGHVSPLLSPEVLRHFQRPGTQTLVQVESDPRRLAGYAPIRTTTGILVGIVYIPRPL
ncbi:MAG: hypothetical protein RMK98_05975, partial [Bacteroidia bacterium]|nr:hypothetical protein [Bacteroidia bacterium]